MSLKILVVEDDLFFRQTVVQTLLNAEYEVFEAKDGREALGVIGLKQPEIIVSDLKIPGMNGVELFHQARQVMSNVSFVFMTGFSDILDVSEAFELGAKGFLNKPFSRLELLGVIDKIAGKERVEKVETSDLIEEDNYVEIAIDEFISGSKIQYPCFLRLSKHKFVRLAYSGEDLGAERILKIKEKGITCLYILKSDFKKYVGFNVELAEKIKKSFKIDVSKKVKFIAQSTELVVQYCFKDHVEPSLFKHAHSLVNSTQEMILESDEIFNLLQYLSERKNRLYAHSMSVAMLSTMMAKVRGWVTPATQFMVVTGALLHDIGLKDLSGDGVNHEIYESDPNLRSVLYNHPIVGAESILKLECLPKGVDQIVMHHHEKVDGSGYPTGLGRVKIHPVAQLIGTADAFLGVFDGGVFKQEAIKLKSALLKFIDENETGYSRENINALKSVFGVGVS